MQPKPLLLSGVLLLVVVGSAVLWLQAQHEKTNAVTFVTEDSDDFDAGPVPGSQFPGLRAVNGTTPVSLLHSLAGERGTLLVIVRELLRSPACRAYLLQLQRYKAEFATAGVNIVVLSPDTPKALRGFARENAIDITLLSDIQSLSITTLGVAAMERQGQKRITTPIPGVLIVDKDNKVVQKYFLADGNHRIHAEALLAAVLSSL